jgi:hypothetical protein
MRQATCLKDEVLKINSFSVRMVRKRISEAQGWQIIGMHTTAMSFKAIGLQMGYHYTLVSRLVRKHTQTNNVKDLPRSARSRVTSDHDDRALQRLVRRMSYHYWASTVRDSWLDVPWGIGCIFVSPNPHPAVGYMTQKPALVWPSDHDDRALQRLVRRMSFAISPVLKQHWLSNRRLSIKTVRNRLKSARLKSRRVIKHQLLADRHRRSRLA